MTELVNNCACHKAKLLFLLKGKLDMRKGVSPKRKEIKYKKEI